MADTQFPSASCLVGSVALSAFGAILAHRLIPEFSSMLIKVNMYGTDQCKRKDQQQKVPEPMGVMTSTVYLIIMFLFIPFPFYGWLNDDDPNFPHSQFVEFIAGLLSICCMVFLGFVDDVLDLRWRHKLFLPTLAALPLLMVYAANFSSTTVIVPRPLVTILGPDVNIGYMYYLFMGMLAVFCTNAVNILAGINGLEAGQSMVIACSIVLFNALQLFRQDTHAWYHQLSIYFLLPYITTTAVLLRYNWYPARVFVGDTFCYFSGMTFAVVGILGHFSKTLLLFFLPQIFNFVFSTPQLFHFVPCPRHRLPKYNADDDRVHMSVTTFRYSQLSIVGKLSVSIFKMFGLLAVHQDPSDSDKWECNNMTILNLVLKLVGPLHERTLTKTILALQVLCSLAAFGIRFGVAWVVYDNVE